ncbi:hypothetical protein D3C75_392270 [compost metagenome]
MQLPYDTNGLFNLLLSALGRPARLFCRNARMFSIPRHLLYSCTHLIHGRSSLLNFIVLTLDSL